MTSRRLLARLCVAVLGVLLMLGLVVTALTGPVGGVAYAGAALVLVGVGIWRGRRLLAPPRRPAGRTCDCCTTTHFDPVEVI